MSTARTSRVVWGSAAVLLGVLWTSFAEGRGNRSEGWPGVPRVMSLGQEEELFTQILKKQRRLLNRGRYQDSWELWRGRRDELRQLRYKHKFFLDRYVAGRLAFGEGKYEEADLLLADLLRSKLLEQAPEVLYYLGMARLDAEGGRMTPRTRAHLEAFLEVQPRPRRLAASATQALALADKNLIRITAEGSVAASSSRTADAPISESKAAEILSKPYPPVPEEEESRVEPVLWLAEIDPVPASIPATPVLVGGDEVVASQKVEESAFRGASVNPISKPIPPLDTEAAAAREQASIGVEAIAIGSVVLPEVPSRGGGGSRGATIVWELGKIDPAAPVVASRAQEKSPLENSATADAASRLQASAASKVLLHFWATWCGPCGPEMPPLLSYLHSERFASFREKGIEAFLVTVDEFRSTAESFLNGRGLSGVELLHDPDLELLQRLSSQFSIPRTMIVDTRDGRVLLDLETSDWRSQELLSRVEQALETKEN